MQLYHWEPNGACARVLIALAEKGLDYEGHYMDVHARAQHRPEYVALSPEGEVPLLLRDGLAMTQSSYICEYLEEAFPDAPALMPVDSHSRWLVRGWQKYVDDHFAGAVSDLAWQAYGKHVDPSVLAAGAKSAPTHERRLVWQQHAAPFPEERIARARDYVAQAVGRMDAALDRHDWLVGDTFSLADIAVYAYAAYLPHIAQGPLTERVRIWLSRMAAREGVQKALKVAHHAPFTIAAPGPEQTRWG